MTRQITIYESAKNGKLTILDNVECSTLGELKELLNEKGIDYNNKEFVEGVTNTKLLADDSRLPENIPFKGKVTNNLFINILNKDNKVKSGMNFNTMSRSELLRAAKPFAAQIEKTYGANYTRVKSADLVSFLSKNDKKPEAKETPAPCNAGKSANHPLVEAILLIADKVGVKEEVSNLLELAIKETPKLKEPESFFSKEDISAFIRKR